jgi:hypothetical protein
MRRLALLTCLLSGTCHRSPPVVPTPDETLGPGEESIPPGEPDAIAEVEQILLAYINDKYGGDKGPARRDAHVKAHGCVMAEVTIRANLPEELARGVFAEPKTYPAWIRFSNSADKPQSDKKPDGRGMAIKLMGVPGPKILPGFEHETTQDFVLINYPVFVVPDATQYVSFSIDTNRGHPLDFFFHGGRGRLPELKSAIHLALAKVKSPLAPMYYSMTPYLLGEGQAVKYGARPCGSNNVSQERCGPDFLTWNLSEGLVDEPACFELMVQRQTDPARMPVENPTVEWDPSVSPYVAVAEIYIPSQRLDSTAQAVMCEQMSFNPWHSLAEHRPLGGINRVRKAVYVAISALRHQLNGIGVAEPRSHDVQAYLDLIGASADSAREAGK